jgi:hypothetical protein
MVSRNITAQCTTKIYKKNEPTHHKREELEKIYLANQETIEEIDNENSVENAEEDQTETVQLLGRQSETLEGTAEHETNSPVAIGLKLIDSTIIEQSDSENEIPATLDSSESSIEKCKTQNTSPSSIPFVYNYNNKKTSLISFPTSSSQFS